MARPDSPEPRPDAGTGPADAQRGERLEAAGWRAGADAGGPALIDRLAGLLLALPLALAFLDWPAWHWQWRAGWLALAVAGLLDREGRLRVRLALTAGLFLLWVGYAELLRDLYGDGENRRELWLWLWHYKTAPQWLLGLWLASGLFGPGAPRGRPRTLACLAALMTAFFAHRLATAYYSLDQDHSINLFRLGGGNYFAMAMLTMRLWARGRGGLRTALRTALWAAALQTAAALVFAVMLRRADFFLLSEYMARAWVRIPSAQDFELQRYRQCFPLLDHNRLGTAMLLNAYFFLLAGALSGARGLRRLPWLLGALAGLGGTLLSMTRGATAVLVAGLAPWVAQRLRWWSLAALLLLPAAFLLLPSAHRRHLESLTSAYVWTQQGGTMDLRMRGWQGALMMMRDRPLTGIGYGTQHFRNVYRKDYRARTGDPERKPHSHNLLLQVGAESGLPGLGLLLGLLGLRWGLLGRALWRRPRDETLWLLLGLELSLFVFSQFFYMFKVTLGLLLWLTWVWSTLYALGVSRKAADAA